MTTTHATTTSPADLFQQQAADIRDQARHMQNQGDLTHEQVSDFHDFLDQLETRIIGHPVIAGNRYLTRFAEGITKAQARHETQQFSVFAIQFDIAQAKLVANAPTREAYLERLKLLLNEKGIPYCNGFEGELTGQWDLRTVHFTWMEEMAAGLGLTFTDIGKLWLAHEGTRQFVDTVFETYGSLNPSTAAGAAFGIETWAANGLWKPWIEGMRRLNETLEQKIPLGYLTYHDKEEQHHSQSTLTELLSNFWQPWFDREAFLHGAETALSSGVQVYYEAQLTSLPDRDSSWPDTAFASPLQDD